MSAHSYDSPPPERDASREYDPTKSRAAWRQARRSFWGLNVEKESPSAVAKPKPCVSLRVLLPELYSGKREWSRWLKVYNSDMGTFHASVDQSVSADEAARARHEIPIRLNERKKTGRGAGGKAGLKNQASLHKQRAGKKF